MQSCRFRVAPAAFGGGRDTETEIKVAASNYALARSVLDPWLERLAKSGTPQQRFRGFRSLAEINGLEAFQRLDWLADVDKPTRDGRRHSAILSVIAHRNRISWKEVRAMIDAGDDEYYMAEELIQAADEMDHGEIGDGEQERRSPMGTSCPNCWYSPTSLTPAAGASRIGTTPRLQDSLLSRT